MSAKLRDLMTKEELRRVLASSGLRYNKYLEMLMRDNYLGNSGVRLLEANGFTGLK